MAFISLNSIPDNEIFPGFSAKIIHSETENLTLVYVTVKAGTELPAHAHPQEQITNVLTGQLEITVGGNTEVLQPGIIGTIPPNVVHSGRALTDCFILDVFHPMRTYS